MHTNKKGGRTMKLIATAQTFSRNNLWTEYEIYKHGARYRVQAEDNGLGWGIFCDSDKPERHWADSAEVRDLLTMDMRDAGVVDMIDEVECGQILDP
jgi:hypothetical protein